MSLAAQGVTSGPLWDRMNALIVSIDGEEHHRLRRLVAKGFTPRATACLHTTITEVTVPVGSNPPMPTSFPSVNASALAMLTSVTSTDVKNIRGIP